MRGHLRYQGHLQDGGSVSLVHGCTQLFDQLYHHQSLEGTLRYQG